MPKRLPLLPLLILALLAAPLPAQPAHADEFTAAQRAEIVGILRDALRTDPSILRDAVAAMQAEDSARQQAAAHDAVQAHRAELVTAADPVLGNPQGDVTVVEFYDTRCPYCRRMLPDLAELLRTDPGVRLVPKDLPILGPSSVLESRALLAAARQNGYAALQAVLMHGSSAPASADTIHAAARTAGLDVNRLDADMRDPAIQRQIDGNLRLAQALNVEGTPALVIGDQFLPGAVDLADLRQMVAAARAGH